MQRRSLRHRRPPARGPRLRLQPALLGDEPAVVGVGRLQPRQRLGDRLRGERSEQHFRRRPDRPAGDLVVDRRRVDHPRRQVAGVGEVGARQHHLPLGAGFRGSEPEALGIVAAGRQRLVAGRRQRVDQRRRPRAAGLGPERRVAPRGEEAVDGGALALGGPDQRPAQPVTERLGGGIEPGIEPGLDDRRHGRVGRDRRLGQRREADRRRSEQRKEKRGGPKGSHACLVTICSRCPAGYRDRAAATTRALETNNLPFQEEACFRIVIGGKLPTIAPARCAPAWKSLGAVASNRQGRGPKSRSQRQISRQ